MRGERHIGMVRGRRYGRRVYVGPDCKISVLGRLAIGEGSRIEAGVRIDARGDVMIGARVLVLAGCWIECDEPGRLIIGDDCRIGLGCVIAAGERVEIRSGSQLAEYVSIRDHDHIPGLAASDDTRTSSPVLVSDGAWLAAKVTVTRGVTIGDQAVVGANAVVTRDVPAGAVAVGVPARVMRQATPTG